MKAKKVQPMPDRWRRFYEAIALATPAQVGEAIEAIGPMGSDGEAKCRLAQALGLQWAAGPGQKGEGER